MTLADEPDTVVEAFRPARNPNAVHVVTRSDALEELLAYLDAAGLERKLDASGAPVHVWHETPEGLSQRAQRQLVSRALAHLTVVGYKVNIDPAEYDVTAWAQAVKTHAKVLNVDPPAQSPPPSGSPPSNWR